MKTPREILLERHRQAVARLDAARERTLARMFSLETPAASTRSRGLELAAWFHGLFLSVRWHLAGLSAAWLAIAVLNLDSSPAPTAVMARQNTPSPRQLLTSLRENRRQLLELIESPVNELVLTPRTLAPPRRSELPSPTTIT